MKLKVSRSGTGNAQTDSKETENADMAAGNTGTNGSDTPEQGKAEADGTQTGDNSANTRTDAKNDNMSEGGKNAAHREGSRHGRFTWNIK